MGQELIVWVWVCVGGREEEGEVSEEQITRTASMFVVMCADMYHCTSSPRWSHDQLHIRYHSPHITAEDYDDDYGVGVEGFEGAFEGFHDHHEQLQAGQPGGAIPSSHSFEGVEPMGELVVKMSQYNLVPGLKPTCACKFSILGFVTVGGVELQSFEAKAGMESLDSKLRTCTLYVQLSTP